MSTHYDDPRLAASVASEDGKADAGRTRTLVIATLLFAIAATLFVFGRFLIESFTAVRFPGELDYGEGIVWEQMRLMLAGRGYGAIDGMPAIVFHYPPLYHMASAAFASVSGIDPLAAGRSVSLGSTLVAGLFAGLIAAKTVRADDTARTAAICGLIAGLSVFGFSTIYHWAPLMRVDMLSLALSFAGVFVAMGALTRPRLIVLSAALFVAAVFTKQTSIVAPAAVFVTFLVLRPRLAWMLAGSCVAMGLVVLGALTLATDGGFARHIFLYNVNRLEASRLASILAAVMTHSLFFVAVVIGVAVRFRARLPHYRGAGSLAALRERLNTAPGDAFFLLVAVYAALALLMSFSIAKSGSNVNYLNEWLGVTAILLGIVMRDAANMVFGQPAARSKSLLAHPAILPLFVGVQALAFVPLADYRDHRSAERVAELGVLHEMVRDARRPIISDDMVLLRQAGVPVQWEPSIFAELASTGAWDEKPFVARIEARQFAFFITAGVRGDKLFDSRYNPAVVDAIDAAYPVKRKLASYTLHFPAGTAR